MHVVTRTALGAALVAALTAATLPSAGAAPAAPRTEKISTAPAGGQADDSSSGPQLSGDGKVVAFSSYASNLVAGDTPGTADVFVRSAGGAGLRRITVEGAETSSPQLSRSGRHLTFTAAIQDPYGYRVHVRDLATGRTERIAPALDAGYAVTGGAAPISADGRYVAVNATPTAATPPSDDDGSRVYLYDRTTKKAVRVSRTPDDADGARGCVAGSISADGRKVAYQDSYTNGPRGDDWGDIFVYDRTTGKTVHADATYDGAEADRASTTPVLSADGSTVAFQSYATNLVPGTDPNRGWNPFVRDLRTGALTRVDGRKPADIAGLHGLSADGSKVLYSTFGEASQGLWLRDLRTGGDVLASPAQDGSAQDMSGGALSADASTAAFAGGDEGNFVPADTNGHRDVFVRHLR
ncbi:TolB family protein [Streptomyces sp. NPDC091272]|uniref:TolB family protein n=1 Tax=Streptomyces sp. NPDC091272 TaxID=3365981 RepID=UPI003809AEDC